jgi:hypothetical protein
MIPVGTTAAFFLLCVNQMPPNFSNVVRSSFSNGDWDGNTPLTALPAVGPYIEGRLRRALVGVRAQSLSIEEFVRGFRGLGTTRVIEILHRALQNVRSNQCVSKSRASPAERTYHAGDVNEHGLSSVIALLEYAKRQRLFNAGLRFSVPLPRPGARNRASRDCGCLGRDECTGPCVHVSNTCVPRDNRSRGFKGSPYHPDQAVTARTDSERKRVRRSAKTSITQQVRNDVDSFSDVNSGNDHGMEYITRGTRMWRKPSPKVRLPLKKR